MSATGPWVEQLVTDWLSGKTVMAMLLVSGIQDIGDGTVPTDEEITGTGYTAGGIDVTSLLSVTYDAGSHSVVVSCDDVTFPALTTDTVGGIAFYSGALLMAIDSFGAVEVSDKPFTYRPSTDGLIAVQISGGFDD